MDENPYIMMTLLDQYLDRGTIKISPKKELLLCATYEDNHGNITKVNSDRGISHLLMLLMAKTCSERRLERDADNLYPFPLGITNAGGLEHTIAMENAYLQLYTKNGEIYARIENVSPDIAGTPGIAQREASGISIDYAIENAFCATPKRVDTFTVL